jgi:two-component system sensor histidine kinase PilS (NtrC family)
MSGAERSSERRTGERRRSRRPALADESWFGAFNADLDTRFADEPFVLDEEVESPAPSEPPGPDAPLDPPAAAQDAAATLRGQSAFERIYRVFIAARAVLGIALIIALAIGGLFGVRPQLGVTLVSLLYAALAISTWVLPRYRRPAPPRAMARLRSPQWLATIGVDLVCFSALHVLAPGSSLNYAALLVLPVLLAGVLTPRLLALATAAAVTLMLLITAWATALAGTEGALQMTQAGLAGTGFFVITVLAGELASRLAREELSARGSLELARQQAQLNRLVIEEMQDGVLVVDRRGRVRAANPAARRLLAPRGMCRPAPFQLRGVAAWDALVKTVERAFREASWPEAGRDVALVFAADSLNTPGAQRTLRARVRFTRKREPRSVEEFCVLFLEDVRNMQARSRQEKLAAMGRVSAGIAHEIRNPLAAISQANALLAEDMSDPAQRQLARMIGENVERLKRIVDDVMEVAPGAPPEVGIVDAAELVSRLCVEWARGAGIEGGGDSVLRVEVPDEPVGVLFDAEHLRRVLVNLLDNARRHASQAAGAIQVRLDSRHAAQAFLSVTSDGAQIPADVEAYLFEPFFSTRSRGTGLGLYICRELCERYGATIDYRVRADGAGQRNEFFVDMQRRPLAPAAAA